MEINLEGLEWSLTVGEYQITGGFEAKCILGDGTGTDWARIRMTDELSAFIKDKDTSTCILEYGGEELLEGYGDYLENADQVMLIKSNRPELASARIAVTFLNCSIQEAARYILTVSGINNYILADFDAGRKTFTIDVMSCEDALQELNTVYGTNVSFFSAGGVFYYGAVLEQEDYYTLTDDNVLDMEKSGDVWTAEIIPVPALRPRKYLNIACEEYTGTGLITKCVIEGGESGTDMYIRFKEA